MDSLAGLPDCVAMPLRVVVVEDDVELRDAVLLPGLAAEDIDAIGVGSAAELYRAMLARSFEIVVLDIGLPDASGFEVVRHLRSICSVGIVLLTGRGSAVDRVRGLGLGADAYLPKPVDVAVLAATLHSLARRLAPRVAPDAIGGWRLHPDGWTLFTPEGHSVELTVSERALLRRLFAAQGQPVGRESLIAELTDDVAGFDPHRLEMIVHRLRRKIAGITSERLPLRALRGKGYLLVSDTRAIRRDTRVPVRA